MAAKTPRKRGKITWHVIARPGEWNRLPASATAVHVKGGLDKRNFPEFLERLSSLTHLRVDDARFLSVSGVAHLAKRKLVHLEYYHAHFLGRGMEDIAKIRTLKVLRFNHQELSDKGFAHLAGLPRLETLEVRSLGMWDKSFKTIARMPRLKELQIHSIYQVTDKGIADLAGMKGLEDLTLGCRRITTASVPVLETLPNLKTLTITETCGISYEECHDLQSRLKARVLFRLEEGEKGERLRKRLTTEEDFARIWARWLAGPETKRRALFRTLPPFRGWGAGMTAYLVKRFAALEGEALAAERKAAPALLGSTSFLLHYRDARIGQLKVLGDLLPGMDAKGRIAICRTIGREFPADELTGRRPDWGHCAWFNALLLGEKDPEAYWEMLADAREKGADVSLVSAHVAGIGTGKIRPPLQGERRREIGEIGARLAKELVCEDCATLVKRGEMDGSVCMGCRAERWDAGFQSTSEHAYEIGYRQAHRKLEGKLDDAAVEAIREIVGEWGVGEWSCGKCGAIRIPEEWGKKMERAEAVGKLRAPCPKCGVQGHLRRKDPDKWFW